jgi:hypothetical protein
MATKLGDTIKDIKDAFVSADKLELEQIQRNIKEQEAQKQELVKVNFPVDAFPPRVRRILETFASCDGFPIEYYCANLIVATAGLLGVSYKARYKAGHTHIPIFYMILVGDSSAGKSMSMKPIFNILKRMEKEHDDAFKAAMETFQDEVFQTSMTDKKSKMPPRPIQRELLVDFTTLEGLLDTMKCNPRGLVMQAEEILAWFNLMNAYRAGADEQFWLKNWDSAFTKITRKGAPPVIIYNPNCQVIGGIQPGVLHTIMEKDRNVTGASARLLFTYPEDIVAPYDSENTPHPSVNETLYKILQWIQKLPDRIIAPQNENDRGQVEDAFIDFTDEARLTYKTYFNKLTDESNENDDDRVKSVIGKLKSYCIRFALVIEMLRHAEKRVGKYQPEQDKWEELDEFDYTPLLTYEDVQQEIKITKTSIDSAIKLTEYYKYTSNKIMQRLETEVDSLKMNQANWYRALPKEGIDFSVAVKSGSKNNISRMTVNRLLNNPKLFRKRGKIYEPLIA